MVGRADGRLQGPPLADTQPNSAIAHRTSPKRQPAFALVAGSDFSRSVMPHSRTPTPKRERSGIETLVDMPARRIYNPFMATLINLNS